MAPQTPRQRQANAKFQKREEQKMGAFRPEKVDPQLARRKQEGQKAVGQPSVSRWVVYLILFILVGGIGLELLRMFF